METELSKYSRPARIPLKKRKWIDRELEHAPVWCSVDLRDGNQALPTPMGPARKLEYFKLLCQVGFKEIEVAFPSASQDEFDFVRRLIEENLIPDDVRISVLTPARKELIRRTAEALKGSKKSLIHLYAATSDLHSRIVFGKDRAQTKELILEGVRGIVASLDAAGLRSGSGFEFSAEEFTDSDPDYVVEICKAIKEIWGPCRKEDFILNLAQTVERRAPFQYADMIEYFVEHYPYMAETTISVHSHNDQGCAVASTEMALMAGAERVEGTLLGNGERTGNVDLLVMGMNLKSRGIDPGLDFSNVPHMVSVIEKCTGLQVGERYPYAGALAFTAFAGSHQDAIRKGLDQRAGDASGNWKVPYLHVDPADVGRHHEHLIRINSQSGKGGVAYVLEHYHGLYLPKNMHGVMGAAVQRYADRYGGEIDSEKLYEIFMDEFMKVPGGGAFQLKKFSRIVSGEDRNEHKPDAGVSVELELSYDGRDYQLVGHGNGPISAIVHAIRDEGKLYDFIMEDYSERSMASSADADVMAFLTIRRKRDNALFYGAGRHANLNQAAILAFFTALNKAVAEERGAGNTI